MSNFEEDVIAQAKSNVDVLLSKHRDYGPSNIALAPGGPLNGLRVRIHDKLARINHIIDSGNAPENEALIDSFLDLANYALIGQLVLTDKWDKADTKPEPLSNREELARLFEGK